jgi:hypothetical protein
VNAYNRFFFGSRRLPVLVVNTDEADFRNRPDDMDGLLRAVERHRGGIETYVPRLGGG